VKYFLFLFLLTGIVFSTGANGAPPYTPGQTTPKVVIETIAGDITIELFPAKAPVSVNNFLQYVNSGFYDGLIIHRITKDPSFEIIQGGGYQPGGVYKSSGLRPPIINESYNGLSNLRATVAMARTDDPNSATSQFYINVTDNPFLDRYGQGPTFPGYCVFGQVISGMDVVYAIQQLPILPPQYAGGLTECPYSGNSYVYIYRQQVRICVSPTGNDSNGLGSIDAPLKTIQKGIDVVNEPGHVVPAPGTYSGTGNIDLDFKGKAITVRAIEPHDYNTIIKTVIDCQASSSSRHRAFYLHTGEEPNSVIKGLTIINGYQSAGGAVRCENTSPTIKNCTFVSNTASTYGGALSCYNSSSLITNCTFSANSALTRGSALCCDYNSSVVLTNSILWNDVNQFEISLNGVTSPSTLNISYSDIDSGISSIYSEPGCSYIWGPSNIDMDPCFVNLSAFDFHLQSKQKQWSDTTGWAKGLNTSPCIDRGNPGSLIEYELSDSNNIRVDMGSFGGTTKAAVSPQGWGLLADLDNNGMINNSDFSLFAGYWLTQGAELPADLNSDNIVDINDLQLFAQDWQRFIFSFIAKRADFSNDGFVNFRDFALLAGQWGQQGIDKNDLNGDSMVDIYDLQWFTLSWLK